MASRLFRQTHNAEDTVVRNTSGKIKHQDGLQWESSTTQTRQEEVSGVQRAQFLAYGGPRSGSSARGLCPRTTAQFLKLTFPVPGRGGAPSLHTMLQRRMPNDEALLLNFYYLFEDIAALDFVDLRWREKQPLLEAHGYMLRPRYLPGLRPSTMKKDWPFCFSEARQFNLVEGISVCST